MRRAFTLIEVLMAACILALLATGTIATTWRLTGFARMKASELAAEAFCSDIAMAYFAQDLSVYKTDDRAEGEGPDKVYHIVRSTDAISTLTRETGSLYDWMPKFLPEGKTKEEDKVVPFWRVGFKTPTFTVTLAESNKVDVVTVKLSWGVKGDPDRQYVTPFSIQKSIVGWSSDAGSENETTGGGE